METTKHKLSKDEQQVLNDLSKYLDTKMYYFGSIQRLDFFRGHSDIDIDIFTDNEYSTISKMKAYLEIPNAKVLKVVWKIDNNVVVGHKIMYKDKPKNIAIEFSIYNEKYRKYVLDEHNKKASNLPLYAVCMLYILKYIYYKWNIIDDTLFKKMKSIIMSTFVGYEPDLFITLDPHFSTPLCD